MASRASISVILLRPLERALEGKPEAKSAFYAVADLSKALLADPDARVSPAQFCVAWAEAARWQADPAFALALAEATPPGAFGIVEYVCRSAATVGEALAQWTRYLGILDDAVRVALVDEGREVALRVVEESEAPAPLSHELCFALVVRNARLLVASGFRVTRVRYHHRATAAHAARHGAFFDAPVTFGASATELVFPRAQLSTPLATADPQLLELLLPTAEEKRAKALEEAPLQGRVRSAMRSALPRDTAQLDTVAKHLGMTGRSLQRRLKEEGTAFQAIRDEVRQELADSYLGQGVSFAEISFLLGFSEPSAFFRAFKRWTGLTPVERKASLAGV